MNTKTVKNTEKKMQLIKELVRKNLRSQTVCCEAQTTPPHTIG